MQQGGNLGSSVMYLKGVGPGRARLLAGLGIETIRDLLLHFPARYEDRRSISPIGGLREGQAALVKGTVEGFGHRYTRRGRLFQVTLMDDTGALKATWFKDWGVGKKLARGDTVVMFGKVEVFKGEAGFTHPEFEVVEGDGAASSLALGRIVPVHPLTDGVSAGMLRAFVHEAVERFSGAFTEWLPEAALRKRRLPDLVASLRTVHFPSTMEEAAEARKRFSYEEFFLMETVLALRRRAVRAREKAIVFKVWPELEARIRSRVPFRLTAAQERVVAEITADMRGTKPMNRLLQGDVGSGKTIVAAWATLVAVANKAQVAFMAPTETLAEQHFSTITRLLEGAKVETVFLGGGLPDKIRRETLESVASGRADLAIGTHALIQKGVSFKRLGLAVIDEQHKFGVRQRADLRALGDNPDVLVMTATPIPRTLTLTLFGDLDVSVIDEMPPGRKPPATRWLKTAEQYDKALAFARGLIKEGRQAFFVYPLIDESESVDLKPLLKSYETLKSRYFPEYRVGLLHGRMKKAEKDAVMAAFRRGDFEILAATTVIEVGIDVPNATIMVVEDAHRFGLAQLHQLRGRIGRGAHASYCFLHARTRAEDAAGRLSLLERTTDGFAIADFDLRRRGPGEFFGTRQHGLPELKAADLSRDLDLLRFAREDAFAVVAGDPDLSKPENIPIKRTLHERLKDKIDLISIG